MTIQDYFIKHPLYEVIDLPHSNSKQNIAYLYSLIYEESNFDMYCVECENHSVFIKSKEIFSGSSRIVEGERVPTIVSGHYNISAKCSRNNKHEVVIYLDYKNSKICKIGQFPALADILTPDLKRYKPAIGDKRVREWSRAIGLTSHGIGVGAFIYLRRVLESLIEEAHQAAMTSSAWNEEEYSRCRFAEKIEMLSGLLPNFIVENKSTYSVLSKGVHELDEETCLKYFPVLSSAIELIAEEKIAQVEIEKRRKATQDAISKISGEIK